VVYGLVGLCGLWLAVRARAVLTMGGGARRPVTA